MKRLIALLLLAPALANADGPICVGTPCIATAGSMTIDLTGGPRGEGGSGTDFAVSGPGFTASSGWFVFAPALGNALDIQ